MAWRGAAFGLVVGHGTRLGFGRMKHLADNEIEQLGLLTEMYDDVYFPTHLVDRIKEILVDMCRAIERRQPADVAALYPLTHAATERINRLQDEFFDAESEIETVARESIAGSFAKIAAAYGFDADTEELVATRDW